MDSPAPYFHWGFILFSAPNLIVIGVMLALFGAALIAPFPVPRPTKSKERKQ